MDGRITTFDDDTQEGLVVAHDGQHYPFALADWRGRGLPSTDTPVRFDVRESRAVQVVNLPERQQRARKRVAAPEAPDAAEQGSTRAMSRRYSSWAIAAVVIAMLGLFLDTLAPVAGLVAAALALLGLRQIRRAPQYYRGGGFCWAAIVLALIVATLSLLLEPVSATRVSLSPPAPDSVRVG